MGTFLRTLDTGMRRLGFLEVMIGDCIRRSEVTESSVLGQRLWRIAGKKQEAWLRALGSTRKLGKEETGGITQDISGRYAKLATEIGLLSEGHSKALTNTGLIFQFFRNKRFFIDQNEAQKLVYFKEAILRRDSLLSFSILNKLCRSTSLTKREFFDWFARVWIGQALSDHRRLFDKQAAARLRSTQKLYEASSGVLRRKASDRVKHILETRLEHLVDLGFMTKKPDSTYAIAERGKAFASQFPSSVQISHDEFYLKIGQILGIERTLNRRQTISLIVELFDFFSDEPMRVVHLDTLHTVVCISSITKNRSLVLPSELEAVEKELSRKFYGKVVFLEDMSGRASHMTIDADARRALVDYANS